MYICSLRAKAHNATYTRPLYTIEEMIRNIILSIIVLVLAAGLAFGLYYHEGNDDYVMMSVQGALLLFMILVRYYPRSESTRLISPYPNYPHIYFLGTMSTIYLILGLADLYNGESILGVYNSNIGFSILFIILIGNTLKK